MVSAGPLTGRTIVVTAPGRLGSRLRELGATVVDAPTITTVDEPVPPDLRVADYDWVVFTSATAVPRFTGGRNVAAVGPATAAALRDAGVEPALMPGEAVAEALVAAFPTGAGRVLLPQAAGARPVVAEGLRAKGWRVDALVAYRTEPVPLADATRTAASSADAVAFTSGSTVTNYLDAHGPVPDVVACIGPITAEIARDRGLTVAVVADPHTVDGLVDALQSVLAR